VDVVDPDLPQDLIGLDCAGKTAEGLVEKANVLVQDSQEFREGRTSGFPAVMEHGIPGAGIPLPALDITVISNAGKTHKHPYLQPFLEQPGDA